MCPPPTRRGQVAAGRRRVYRATRAGGTTSAPGRRAREARPSRRVPDLPLGCHGAGIRSSPIAPGTGRCASTTRATPGPRRSGQVGLVVVADVLVVGEQDVADDEDRVVAMLRRAGSARPRPDGAVQRQVLLPLSGRRRRRTRAPRVALTPARRRGRDVDHVGLGIRRSPARSAGRAGPATATSGSATCTARRCAPRRPGCRGPARRPARCRRPRTPGRRRARSGTTRSCTSKARWFGTAAAACARVGVVRHRAHGQVVAVRQRRPPAGSG